MVGVVKRIRARDEDEDGAGRHDRVGQDVQQHLLQPPHVKPDFVKSDFVVHNSQLSLVECQVNHVNDFVDGV